MGLQGQLNDVISDSIPLYLVALLATFFSHLRSLLHSLFSSSSSTSRFGSSDSDPSSFLGTGLAGLIVLSEQLTLNRDLSYTYTSPDDVDAGDSCPGRVSSSGSNCVFCLSGLKNGDRVRKLSCCHVFHKDCFDGWLDQMRFSCPLCRSSVVSKERVGFTDRRSDDELVAWFTVR